MAHGETILNIGGLNGENQQDSISQYTGCPKKTEPAKSIYVCIVWT